MALLVELKTQCDKGTPTHALINPNYIVAISSENNGESATVHLTEGKIAKCRESYDTVKEQLRRSLGVVH